MPLLLTVLLLIVSLFLVYQGLCFYDIISMTALFLDKFATNNMLLLVRAVLSKYSLILGVVGVGLSLFLFLCRRTSDKDEKVSNSFWVLLVIYSLVVLFTII